MQCRSSRTRLAIQLPPQSLAGGTIAACGGITIAAQPRIWNVNGIAGRRLPLSASSSSPTRILARFLRGRFRTQRAPVGRSQLPHVRRSPWPSDDVHDRAGRVAETRGPLWARPLSLTCPRPRSPSWISSKTCFAPSVQGPPCDSRRDALYDNSSAGQEARSTRCLSLPHPPPVSNGCSIA